MDTKLSALAHGAPALLSDAIFAQRGAANPRLLLSDLIALGFEPNGLVNGSFDFTRYGPTSQAITIAAAYGSFDRWWTQQVGAAASTLSQVAATVTGQRFAAKLQRTAGSALTGTIQLGQALETAESVARYAGEVATLSVYARKGANFSGNTGQFRMAVDYGTGTDQSSILQSSAGWTAQVQTLQSFAPTALDAIYSMQVAIPANATQLGVRLLHDPTGVAGADDSITFHAAWLDDGPAVHAFTPELLPLELIRCKRWLPVFKNDSAATYILAPGHCTSAGAIVAMLAFDVETRVPPTGISASAAAHFAALTAAGGVTGNGTGIVYSGAQRDSGNITLSGLAGLVAGNSSGLITTNAAARLLFTGAEL